MEEINWNNLKNKLHNYTENIFIENMKKLLGKYDVKCTCEECILDMIIYVLNRLPVKYFSSDMGNIYTKLSEHEKQSMADIATNLTKAVQIVAENPPASCKING